MRKQTKLVAVLSAAALLAIGASMTSFAASGWTEEDGTWVYYDKDGYRVTDTWKKSGNYWYYLDEDGYMATSRLIENSDDNNNIYYVNEEGRMVANCWVELENEDYYDGADDDDATETVWYYFQNSGKAYKANDGYNGGVGTSFKTINGKKYAFDENGKMQWGWLDEELKHISGDEAYQTGLYYCGDSTDGARVTSDWRNLYISQPDKDSEDDYYWFYFGTNGKKYFFEEDGTGTLGDAKSGRKINGKYYTFDEHGVMQSGWYDNDVASPGLASTYVGHYSTSEDGSRRKGWFEVVPSSRLDSAANNDDEAKWFYANNDGTLVSSAVKTINGKKYAFNANGEMLTGLWVLAVDATDNSLVAVEEIDIQSEVEHIEEFTNGVYYFGDDGAMKTGNQTVEVDGENYQFNFAKKGEKKGQGVNGVQSNVLYVNGKRIKADSDYRYQVVDANGNVQILTKTDADPAVGYLINTSGSIMKGSSPYTDSDGKQYKVSLIEDGDNAGQYSISFLGYKN